MGCMTRGWSGAFGTPWVKHFAGNSRVAVADVGEHGRAKRGVLAVLNFRRLKKEFPEQLGM